MASVGGGFVGAAVPGDELRTFECTCDGTPIGKRGFWLTILKGTANEAVTLQNVDSVIELRVHPFAELALGGLFYKVESC